MRRLQLLTVEHSLNFDKSLTLFWVYEFQGPPLTFLSLGIIPKRLNFFFFELVVIYWSRWLLLETTTTWQSPEQPSTRWLKKLFPTYEWPTTPGSLWWTAARSSSTWYPQRPMKYATSPIKKPYLQSTSSTVSAALGRSCLIRVLQSNNVSANVFSQPWRALALAHT